MNVNGHDVAYLGFDVFGTVVDWRSGVARAVESFLARGGSNVDSSAFADEWQSLYRPSMQRVRDGERPWVKLEILRREGLETVLARHDIDADSIAEVELADVSAAWDRLDPWPDSVDGLTRLKRRCAIGTISNGSIAGMLNLARFGGLPWAVITGAEIAKTYKPTPRVYLESVEAVGLSPERTCMVAAHNGDLEAARSVGMRTIYVRRPREYGPDQTTDLEPTADWDLVAESLVEVAEKLGCP